MTSALRAVVMLAALLVGGLTAPGARAAGDGRDAAFAQAFAGFAARFVTSEGRVVDDYNGAISHSEGQGYGMICAALANDRPVFDRIWTWTRANLLVRDDGLAAWRWEPDASPHVTDTNNATDGDLLIAWALVEAGARWGGAYAPEGRRIADAIARHLVFSVRGTPMLRPAAAHFGAGEQADGPVINLSYWVFPALQRLAAADPKGPWPGLVASGLALIDESRFGPAALPSDWISVKWRPVPATMKPPRFGYDAIRVPLYLAWAFPRDRGRLAPFAAALRDGHPHVVELEQGQLADPFGGEGFRLLGSLVACRRAEPPPDLTKDSYYPSAIGLLSLLALGVQRCDTDDAGR